ncbi:MAG TPA: 30S ribosomal protein S21 [Planctomycetota bacterium]|nr:30S ribosomal protein S21 [Planctomycetota bacterium]
MSVRVKARASESVDQMIRRLRKACEREGMHREMKRKEFYEKPSEIKRRRERQLLRKLSKYSKRLDEKLEKRRT